MRSRLSEELSALAVKKTAGGEKVEMFEHINGKYPFKNDVAVLCIFWTRPDCFGKSFASVTLARPKTLLLWQDGPKTKEQYKDWVECQNIATKIDWDCDVYRFYHKRNIGIWPGAHHSHKWAFSKVDKCIILEDDVVPSQSFYPFCKDLLDRYEDDQRIGRITGKMQVEGYKCPYSYFFADGGSVWGWATWKRVAKTWEEDYEFLNDEYVMAMYKARYNSKPDKEYINVCIKHSEEKRAHWETVSAYAKRLNNQLDIVPSTNLVENVGTGGKNSIHFSHIDLRDMPKSIRNAYFSKAEDIDFPLKHPKYVFPDVRYIKRLRELTGSNSQLSKIKLEVERYFLYIKHGHGRKLLEGIGRRIRRLTNKSSNGEPRK